MKGKRGRTLLFLRFRSPLALSFTFTHFIVLSIEAALSYLLVEDGLRQLFGEDFLLDLEVRPWCRDIQ
jgi:hypothetical protein